MYAELYRWFTEISGLGFKERAATLMHRKQAAREDEVAQAIEVWLEKVNRLGRHGVEYQLPDSFKLVALKKILVGKIRDNYDLRTTDRLPFEELLSRVAHEPRGQGPLTHDATAFVWRGLCRRPQWLTIAARVLVSASPARRAPLRGPALRGLPLRGRPP